MTEIETASLPENAYLPLKPGESYTPILSAEQPPPELTLRAVFWGVVFCVLFSVASAYSGLKVGQGMEAAIPISILAIGLARAFRRRTSLLENVIITGIGAASGSVVAGAIFTLPALYILHLDPHPVQTIFICLAGGCLGVLFLIPLRRYFVREMHGQLPFPEATAITEVLVTGEKGGSQARLLIQATIVAAVYDFFVTTFHVWKEYLDFQFVPVMRTLADKGRMVFNFDAIGFIMGLGYVMGLRSSLIFCAGGILSNFVLVPMIWFVGSHINVAVYPAILPISNMSALEIYRSYVRFIGVGAIATAGIVGILKSFGIALHAFRHGEAPQTERTDRDIPVLSLLLGVVVGSIAVAIFFGKLHVSWTVLAMGLLLTLLFSFFFTSVAANAIATTANNPASGMTMLTVIVSAVVLLSFGLSGTTGMFFVMAIAGMVCTALCVSGQFITDLKAGYWIGSTPSAQEKVKFLGSPSSCWPTPFSSARPLWETRARFWQLRRLPS
jgi:putative OPT family oligopeptide transporter